MSREPTPTWAFAVTVVRRGEEFLLVEEGPDVSGWYFPAGRVEPGETIPEAAIREIREEAGVEAELTGIYRVQYTPLRDDAARLRVVFVARPSDDSPPKSQRDEHSLSARWVTIEEVAGLQLREPEVREIIDDLASGAPVHPLSLLGVERRFTT